MVWYEGSGLTNRTFLIPDERGSVIAGTSSTGVTTFKNVYDEYGKPGSANQGRFQYTGQMWLAEVGVYHYKARLYDPGLGRFLQTDPIGYADGLNLYAYVGGDPVNATDPSGLACTITTGGRGDPLIYCRPDASGHGGGFHPGAGSGGSHGGNGGEGGEGNRGSGKEDEGDSDEGNCSHDPISEFARDAFRGANGIGNATIEGGTKIAQTGAGVALAGAPFGASEVGVAIFGVGAFGITVGSGISGASGAGLFFLGDRRAGAEALLDAAFGRVLKSVPDELSPATDASINNFYNRIIDALDSLDGELGDDFTSPSYSLQDSGTTQSRQFLRAARASALRARRRDLIFDSGFCRR